MASVLGGLVYWALWALHVNSVICVVAAFVMVCVVRFLAVRYHISLPKLHDED